MRCRIAVLAGSIALIAGSAAVAAPLKTKRASTTSPAQSNAAQPERPIRWVMERETRTPSQIREQMPTNPRGQAHSVARDWNEMLLFAIRRDFARPTVHARNLYHISAAMYDAWAAYDAVADQVLHHEKLTASDVQAARQEAISFAAYRLIQRRFLFSPGVLEIYQEADLLMDSLGYDKNNFSTVGNTPAALGNRIAETVLAFGYQDGSNEQGGYANQYYEPVNPPLLVAYPGNPDLVDPNRWQPLALEVFKDQNGNPIPGGYPPFLSPEWGLVTPFSLREDLDLNIYQRDGNDWWVWHDPGAPPYLGEPGDLYKWGFEMVTVWQSHLDPADGVMWDVSPNSIGNQGTPPIGSEQSFHNFYDGGDQSQGYDINPVTGQPYPEQIVPRGDYARILAEFWADGPASETPPGHWFTILNYVLDHPDFEYRWKGQGPLVDPLEFDVKAYLSLGGAMHDIAISCWSIKGYYDYIRPVSAIRYLCEQGQCTDPELPSYNPNGINLRPGLIEVVTPETTAPGQRHEHLAGAEGKIALYTWRGHSYIDDPLVDVAGVGWILADNWWPYQRPSFVTPPFAGYMSGHSTYSRGAAEVLSLLTGSPYFPGGLGEFHAPQNEFLHFEDGPSVDVYLQWASYKDASDQCSLSRIWGGIHPPADDLPGRQIGRVIGPEAFFEAERYFNGQFSCPADFTADALVTPEDVTAYIAQYLDGDMTADLAPPFRTLNFFDIAEYLNRYLAGCP
ncbi:MAG: hypothetical protein D6692_01120 [Planctomycetota bacterium]|nr:MAG: hypothetical protein D6692_01120 [Planctomycetota bacterium]